MPSFAYTLSDNHAFSCTVVNLERAIENGFPWSRCYKASSMLAQCCKCLNKTDKFPIWRENYQRLNHVKWQMKTCV